MHRPHFTYVAENREAEEALEEDELDDKYSGFPEQPQERHHSPAREGPP